jgi:hypothetical protein
LELTGFKRRPRFGFKNKKTHGSMSKYIRGVLPFVNHEKNLVKAYYCIFSYFSSIFILFFIC